MWGRVVQFLINSTFSQFHSPILFLMMVPSLHSCFYCCTSYWANIRKLRVITVPTNQIFQQMFRHLYWTSNMIISRSVDLCTSIYTMKNKLQGQLWKSIIGSCLWWKEVPRCIPKTGFVKRERNTVKVWNDDKHIKLL